MASAYPSGFDSLAKPTATTKEDDAGFEHDIVHTNEANAIEAVQTTLGLNPEGAFTTVDDRIADLEVLGKPVLSKVRNSTGATLTKGTAVYLSGATGNHVNVTKALATTDATSARTQGFVWEDIANNADGYVIVEGYLENIDTSAAASDGQIVYLSGSVAGGWTVTKPVAPIHLVYLGVIAKKNPSTGAIYVKVQNGFELDEIHDVLISSKTNGDLLKYDSATDLWKNSAQSTLTVAQSQVTGLVTDLSGKVGTARTISTTAPLAGGGDLSANRTLTIADATTAVKGAVQLTDSTSSTLTTTAATPNAVKSAYDLANGAVPKSTVTTTGDLIVANGASSVTRLAAGTSGQVLTANGAGVAPTYQTASGDGKVVYEGANVPNNATGANGDFMVLSYEGGLGFSNYARLIGPKASGVWPTGGANSQINSAGDYIGLPQRSKTMKSSDLLPGWQMDFDTTWATGTVPSDLTRDGTFGGAWYSSASGTTVGLSRYKPATGAGMAFFSGQFKITTLPESTRFFYFGQIITSGSSVYGYCARIDSAGAVTIRIEDAIGTSSTLDSGMTVAVNDSVLVERFGYRFTVMKTATTGREWLDADAAATSRPLNARIGQGSTDSLYARLFGASSFGLATNSASVRVSEVGFVG
jgi:hypothetical protein